MFEIYFWTFTLNGQFINNGSFFNNAEMLVSGEIISNDDFTNDEFGSLYMSDTAVFLSYGSLTINEFITGWANSYLLISGPFINDDDAISFYGKIDIDLEPGELFINNGFFLMYGQLRLEGEMINNAHLFFDEVNGDFTLADNSKLVNNGLVEVAICHMSSQMDGGTILGNFIIKNDLVVQATIPEVF